MSELDMMVYSILRRNLKSDCIGIHHKIGTINIGIKNTKEMSTGRGVVAYSSEGLEERFQWGVLT